MESLAGTQVGDLTRVDFFTSHEALLLESEQALTRTVPRRSGWWNLGTHLPWIGLRTADPGGGHVEYMRGIRNPVAVKVGAGRGGPCRGCRRPRSIRWWITSVRWDPGCTRDGDGGTAGAGMSS